jgi:serine/threonine protein kinase
MPPADPPPPADDFPAGQTGDMRDVLLSPPTGPKTPAGPWQPPSAEELQKLLPQYEITALLGRGGMGAVYKGRQIALDRPVAIKILSNTLDEADASFAERFKNEARALGKLSHPGIVGVYDFGEAANGLLYIVMEFIDGTDVARMLAQQKRLHTEHAMAITAHVCDALAYAHERGIIHRDIKPANIMVGYDGVVKVADFGLAKMTHSQNSGLTQSGMAMGTLHYMAPEALMLGSAVDHRADIYAVGVMLYQMLTGKVPHGMFELPSLQVPGLDPRYDSIISRAMREDREVRYQAAAELRHDLDAILTQPVVKVEAAAEKAPAALETLARPQRPAGQPYRPPQREVIVRTEKKGAPLLWVAVVALAALAAWLYLNRTVPESAPQPPSLVTGTPPGPAVNESSASTTSNPADATQDRPFVNSLGMKFVPVPGTKVLFCIHETRHKDYAVYATENSSVNARWRTARVPEIPDFKSSDNDPLFGVNWNESKAFCEWLSRKEGVKYRLPSDREWSHAVGIAGRESVDSLPADLGKANSIIYPWGQGWPPPKGAGNFSDESVGATTAFPTYIRGYNDKYPGPSPVMSFPPNKLGLHDLGGNVSEWCEDWYDSSKKERVLRDSTWYCDSPSVLFSSRRFNLPPDYAGGHIGRGFRCVIDLASQPVITKPITANTPPLSGPAFNAHKAGLTMPKGRQSHGSSQYEFVATACTWDEARQKAEEMGGHLATITSKEENDWIKQTYGNLLVQGCQHFWLGGRQDTPDAAWRWITAEPFYFKAWNPGRPGQGAKALHPRFMNFYHARTAGEPIGWSDLISGGEFDQDRVGFLVEWDGTQPPAAPALPTGPTTWTDTKGRSITATFKALASGNVLLEIVGKVTPVPLNTLSAESQKLARAYHDQSSAPAANDPAKATKDKPFTNSLGMKFVPVPGTKVLMCIHETRNQDYAAYAASNPAVDDKWKSAKQDAGLPAAFVNWHEATAFCEWLTQKDGIKHRLPTDREWSFAIGIGNQEDAQSSRKH